MEASSATLSFRIDGMTLSGLRITGLEVYGEKYKPFKVCVCVCTREIRRIGRALVYYTISYIFLWVHGGGEWMMNSLLSRGSRYR